MKILEREFGAELVDHVLHEAVCDALVRYARTEMPGVGPVFTYNDKVFIDIRTDYVTGPDDAIYNAARDAQVMKYLNVKLSDILQAAILGSLP
jgi:hypothetical protein